MNAIRPALSAAMFAVALAALLACGDARGATPTAGPVSGQEEGKAEASVMVNRIAYIDNSGDLLLINPDGTGQERLTGNVRAGLLAQSLQRGDSYSWPTWSPDGSRVAASRVSISGQDAGLSLQVFDVASGRMSSAYQNDVPAPVADGAPHYIYWSPDSRYLSFLAPAREGLALRLRDFEGAEESATLAVGAPLYYHWSRDASVLAVHSGDRLVLSEPDPRGVQAPLERGGGGLSGAGPVS